MLTLEQIMELQNKGFTWEQIATVNTTLGQAEAKPEPETPEAPGTPEAPEAPGTPEAPEAKPETDATAILEKKIDEMAATIKEMQATNVKKAEMDAPKPLTADDVIKSFMEAS